MMCPRLKAPIVLAHGLLGFSQIGWGPIILTSYFREIPDILAEGGNRVLVTHVHPTAGIAFRAEKLKQRIQRVFPDEPVHLIGHSMGGLDARVLLTDPAWAGRVLSLTTVGSPHLGSAVADAARLRVGPIYRLLERLGIDHNGFLDLTRRSARAWHRRARPPEGVACFSLAGDPAPEDVCWPLQAFHARLSRWEGPNDGLVSVESALAFGTPLPLWPVDHLRQVNWLSAGPVGLPRHQVGTLYSQVIANLAGLGFAAEDDPEGDGCAPGSVTIAGPWRVITPQQRRMPARLERADRGRRPG